MEVFDEAIANGLQRNPNLSILDAKVIFPQVLDGSSASSIPARGWLQNMGANLSADPSLDAKLRGPRDEDWWYTGLTPSQYFTSSTSAEAEDWVYKPLPHPDLSNVTRQQAIDYFQRSWFLTDLLFSGLQGLEAFYRPPYHNQRHPLIFYYVHPAVLYINKFRLAGLVKAPINQEVEILFESGVDSMTWDDLSKNDNLWPLFSVCIEYRRQAYQHIMSILSSHPELGEGDEPVAVTPASSMWALFLGIAHEAIHNETSSVLFRELPLALLQAPPYWPHLPSAYRVITPSDASTFGELKRPEPGSSFPLNDFVEVKSQRLTLGRAHSTVRTFGWDNEFGQAHVTVPSFSVTKFPITNGEFYSFVSSGEYVNDSWWSRDGAAWRSSRNIKAPTFWVALGPQGLQHYGLRTIFHIVELPWSAPVCVNFYEAEAFTAWRAAQSSTPLRLTTEPEMTVLRKSSYPAFSPSSSSSSSSSSPPPLPLDPAIAEDESLQDPLLTPETSLANNLNLSFGAETPVDLYPPTKLGTYDVCGNVWHWCKDFFLPLPGFKVHPYYSDFSTPCFDRAHHSIFGGSFISTGNLANIFARYHFRPFFFQHSGFRIAVSTEGNVEQIPTLEVLIQTEQEKTRLAKASRISTKLSAQISRHFNVPDDNSRLAPGGHAGHGYPQRLFSVVEAALAEHSVPRKRALDLASGVGGVSFELARHFEAVVGLDISKEWVDIAESLKAGKAVSFPVVEEAPVYKELSYSLPPELLSASERCTFHACDGSHPHASLGTFNLVIFSDILSRIPAPRQSLISCKDRVATGGILALITSSQYCNNFYGLPDLINSPTAPESPLPTVEVVTGILSPYFDFLKQSDLPLINRISQREYNLKLYSVTLWKRK